MDQIEHTETVVFIGDYFTLMTTVVLSEELREVNETDRDLAIRLASSWMLEQYGWDVAEVSNEVGLVEE